MEVTEAALDTALMAYMRHSYVGGVTTMRMIRDALSIVIGADLSEWKDYIREAVARCLADITTGNAPHLCIHQHPSGKLFISLSCSYY